MDYATRYPETIALKGSTAKEIAEALMTVFSRVCIPEEILTDQGCQFTANYMKELVNMMDIKYLMSSPYHPMCNGLVEAFNGSLKHMLIKLCIEQPPAWHKFIHPLQFAYREVLNETTGFSPFELVYGRNVRGLMQILQELWTGDAWQYETRTTYDYVINLRDKLETVMKIAQENINKAQIKHKIYYNKCNKSNNIIPVDKVLILQPNKLNLLQTQWTGPCEVARKINSSNYMIKLKNRTKIYHANLLKKYVE